MPIARLFQRRILWMSGLADKFLDSAEKKKKVNNNDDDNSVDSDNTSYDDEELIHDF